MRAVVVSVVLTAAVTSVVMYILQFGVRDWSLLNGSASEPVRRYVDVLPLILECW
jgi:hypothetical protein